MWKRKSDFEIEEVKNQFKKKARSPKYPIIGSVIGFIVVFFTYGFTGTKYGEKVTDFGEAFKLAAMITFVLFPILYFAQIRFGRPIDMNTFSICKKCLKSNHNGDKTCSCGGQFEPEQFYKTVDNDKTSE